MITFFMNTLQDALNKAAEQSVTAKQKAENDKYTQRKGDDYVAHNNCVNSH